MLEIVQGYLRIEKCKRRVRSLLFWPHVSADIENVAQMYKSIKNFSIKEKESLIHRSSKLSSDCVKASLRMFIS